MKLPPEGLLCERRNYLWPVFRLPLRLRGADSVNQEVSWTSVSLLLFREDLSLARVPLAELAVRLRGADSVNQEGSWTSVSLLLFREDLSGPSSVCGTNALSARK